MVLTHPAVAGHPRLSPSQQRRAAVAGAVSLALIAAGVDLIGIVVVQVAFYFGLLVVFGSLDAGRWSDWSTLSQLGSGGLWGVPTWVFIATGCLLVLAGFATSWVMLARHEVARPLSFTWAAVGISVVPGLMVAVIAYVVASVTSSSMQPTEAGDSIPPSLFVVLLVVDVALSAAIGAAVWWWLARAFRARRA
ncbi:hypothetical protein [Subtercola sp. YIM 133946]|uniref:hypothetical protein n=1 Tax=Subtercola sp. YIM 133946 TaxID=3118909 RepID=UPI002F926E96